MMKQILSFGAGVNTMGLLALAKLGKIHFDYVLFADTGCEWPETYNYIEEVAKPLCEDLAIPFVTVRGQEGKDKVDNLYDYAWKFKFVPLRQYRICTDKFKVKPIKKWVFSHLDDFEMNIGIDFGEKHRARNSGVDYPINYPLVEQTIDRKGCKTLIKEAGIPQTRKTGCYICPFQRISQWRELWDNHKELYMKAEKLEKHSKFYPKTLITYKPLEQIRGKRDNSIQEDLDGGYVCMMCHL